MIKPRLTTPAIYDVLEITEYIAEDNPLAAERWVQSFDATIIQSAGCPDMGSTHPDVPEDIRLWSFGRYIIFYRERNSELTIIRVQHGARDWSRLFQENSVDDGP